MTYRIAEADAAHAATEIHELAARLTRDAATLMHLSHALQTGTDLGRTVGQLRRYADHFKQTAADEVRTIVAELDATQPPKHVKRRRAERERHRTRATDRQVPASRPLQVTPIGGNVVAVDFRAR